MARGIISSHPHTRFDRPPTSTASDPEEFLDNKPDARRIKSGLAFADDSRDDQVVFAAAEER
jgi:hypothetical protein